MRKSHALAGAAALALMALAPLSFAQTQAPPTTEQPAAPPTEPTPATPPADAPTATPAQPATPPANPNPVSPTSPPDRMASVSPSAGAPEGCRTRKPAGDSCACLSDTSRIGTATAHPSGHNVCVRPD